MSKPKRKFRTDKFENRSKLKFSLTPAGHSRLPWATRVKTSVYRSSNLSVLNFRFYFLMQNMIIVLGHVDRQRGASITSAERAAPPHSELCSDACIAADRAGSELHWYLSCVTGVRVVRRCFYSQWASWPWAEDGFQSWCGQNIIWYQQVKVDVANNDKRAKCWCGTGKVGVAMVTPAIWHSSPMIVTDNLCTMFVSFMIKLALVTQRALMMLHDLS